MEQSFIPIALGEHWLLVDATHVREILGRRQWVPVPGSRAELPGVLAWQGRAIAVVDVAPFFSLPPLTQESRARMLLVSIGAVTMAVPVDSVRELQVVKDVRPLRPPQSMASQEGTLGDQRLPILDLSALNMT